MMTPDRHSTPPNGGSSVGLPCKPAARLLLPLLLVCTSGCGVLGPYSAPPPEPARQSLPAEPSIPIEHEAASMPVPRPPKPPVRQPLIDVAPAAPTRVLVLLSSDAKTYRDVAIKLDHTVGNNYELEQVNLAEQGAGNMLLDNPPGTWTAAVAIGTDAAEFAGTELDVPTVFCQIFEYEPLLAHGQLFGVEAQPPLNLQLASWKQIAADASTVGIIVGTDDSELVAAARDVATSMGLELNVIVADSDREALYQFKRLAQSVDGLWLFPDSDILSPRALREILEYALDHGVHSIVFNETLLDWGALLSVTGNAGDIAAVVTRVLESLLSGGIAELERVTPLTTVDVDVNHGVAEKLGLAPSTNAGAAKLLSARAGGT